MFCPSCGSFAEGSNLYCQTCGCKLDDEKADQPVPQPAETVFPATPPSETPGNRTSTGIDHAAPKRARASKRKKGALAAAIITCIITAAAGGFIGGFFYAKGACPSYFGLVFVNDVAFPDEALRSFVSQYVDADNNGIITPNENAAFTQFDAYNPELTAYVPAPLETDPGSALSSIAFDETYEYAMAEDRSESESSHSQDAPPSIGSLAGLEHFTSLKALICPNMGLTELNLSSMPSLTYVDCRGNDFGVLDLTFNGTLRCLYCDDDVYLSGIDEAGLYCDNLLTSASTSSSEFFEAEDMKFSYDTHGRMVKGNDKAYFYNSLGMLAGARFEEAERNGELTPAYTDEYLYDQSTRTMKSVRNGIGYDAEKNTPKTYSYETVMGFDDAGRLTGEQATVPTRLGESLMDVRQVSYVYDGDAAEPTSSARNSSIAGTNADKVSFGESSATTLFTYQNGQLSKRMSAVVSENGEQPPLETIYARENSTVSIASSATTNENGHPVGESTLYDDRGYPVQTATGRQDLPNETITYECNIDGYITKASWDFGNSVSLDPSKANRVITMNYVKHVGSASYKQLLPTLPTYVFASAQDYGYIDMRWQPSNGLWFSATIIEVDPLIKAKERAGLIVSTVRSGMRLLNEGPSEWMWPWRVNVLWTPTATTIPDEAFHRVSTSTSDETTVEIKSMLSEYSWDDLSLIAEQIKTCSSENEAVELAKRYNLVDDSGNLTGMSIPIIMADGTTLDIELVGIFHDDKSDDPGKAGLTFMTSNAYCNHPMNETATNEGGWKESDMRTWLNSAVLESMPESLRNLIVPVDKATNNIGRTESGDSASITSDRIWLFSQAELYGPISWNRGYDTEYIDTVLNNEGTQYQLFSEAGIEGIATTDKKGILRKYVTENGRSELSNWWVRSPTPNRTDGFGDVDNGAPDNGGTASASQGVVFGFCL